VQEKHEREGAGNEKVRETHKGISGLKGQMNRNAEVRLPFLLAKPSSKLAI